MPQLDKLVVGGGAPEKIAGGFGFTEGPVFSRIGYLLFSDLGANRIQKWEAGSAGLFRDPSNGANGLTFDHQGRLLACERGRVTRTEKNGSLTVLAERYRGKLLNGPNDLVYAIDGSVYFSDVRRADAPADASRTEKSAVYRIDRKGEVRLESLECEMPNGVALSPDQQKLYVGDTRGGNIRVYEIAGDGSLKNGRVFAAARPDGLKTDEDGNVWTTDDQAVTVFDSGGGRLGSIRMPEMPSNCAWGDGFRNLYVTARTSVYRVKTNVNGTRTY